MKNILFGLMSISMISFAALPTLTDTPDNNKPVFQTGQTGEISVTGNLKKNPEIIKYVVFASTDGQYTGADDQQTWTLPPYIYTFYTSTPADTSGLAFAGKTIPKLYVKKVNSTSDDVIELSNEIVSYKLNLDPALNLTKAAVVKDFSSNFDKTLLNIWAFMSKTELETMLEGTGARIRLVEDTNRATVFPQASNNASLYGGAYFHLLRESTGVLAIQQESTFSSDPTFPANIGNKVAEYLATPRNGYAGLSISVKVN